MRSVETPQGKGLVHDDLSEVLVSLRAVRRLEGDEHYLATSRDFDERRYNLWDLIETSDGPEVTQYVFTGDDRTIIRDALRRQAKQKGQDHDQAMAKLMLDAIRPASSLERCMIAGQRLGHLAFSLAFTH